MKGTVIVLLFFIAGCIAGWSGLIDMGKFGEAWYKGTMCILYLLIFTVGIGMGCNKDLKRMIKTLSPKLLLLPAATIAGSLLFSAILSLFLSRWSLSDCLAVGSGLGYYSLSSVLIAEYKEASLGVRAASELGTIALLVNIFRELFTLVAAQAMERHFGPFAPVASAGATAMDVCLPVILRVSGSEILPAAIVSGIICDFSVPFLVSFFCSF